MTASAHEGEHKCDHAAAAKTGRGNPLVEEMLILDGVFREVVSAVSLGDGERVYRALHSMHGTMEKTHEGVHHGTVKLSKDADKIETFACGRRERRGLPYDVPIPLRPGS